MAGGGWRGPQWSIGRATCPRERQAEAAPDHDAQAGGGASARAAPRASGDFWLFRVTVNVATDRHRQRGAQSRAFGPERVTEEEWARTTPDPGGGPDQEAVRAEQRGRIKRALDALPPKARTIIMPSDVEGLSYREIAEVLNCPIGTVMSRLHNARKRLKTLLGP